MQRMPIFACSLLLLAARCQPGEASSCTGTRELVEFLPEDYWHLVAKSRSEGGLSDVEKRGTCLVGKAWGHHGYYKFRVDKEGRQDDGAKLRGFIAAVSETIEDGLAFLRQGRSRSGYSWLGFVR